MTGNPEDPAPGNPLRLKQGAPAAAGGTCPSCKSSMGSDAVVCLHCGFNKSTGRHMMTSHRSPSTSRKSASGGWAWAVFVFFIRLALVAAIVAGLYAGYGYYERYTSEHAGMKLPYGVCPECRGQGKVKCPTCGGAGSVDKLMRVKCDQCGGTGKYMLKVGKGKVTCPFCKGLGYNEVMGRETCTNCEGRGWITCPKCGGTGKT